MDIEDPHRPHCATVGIHQLQMVVWWCPWCFGWWGSWSRTSDTSCSIDRHLESGTVEYGPFDTWEDVRQHLSKIVEEHPLPVGSRSQLFPATDPA